MFFRLPLTALALFLAGFASPAWAGSKDKDFFESVAGQWSGPGEIVAGKYKGTKFVCKLSGGPSAEHAAGVTMDGRCRVGIFSQKMSAFIGQQGSDYTGRFLDGAEGEGLDIISGQITGNKIVVGINRKRLNGAMVAHLEEPNVMNVTISVRVRDELIPVIGMTLSRGSQVGSVGGNERELSR
ncbi:MAG: hypothetical protein GY789_09430 [Hyphomicrobiales bacterium]|nr:hypothetical protein [Hyphomicrobiales bacterium]MCP4998636.1 hypothetical protein [Hyphomicrobiales bacterium]